MPASLCPPSETLNLAHGQNFIRCVESCSAVLESKPVGHGVGKRTEPQCDVRIRYVAIDQLPQYRDHTKVGKYIRATELRLSAVGTFGAADAVKYLLVEYRGDCHHELRAMTIDAGFWNTKIAVCMLVQISEIVQA